MSNGDSNNKTPTAASVRKASSFLKSIGLSYDKVSPATQKYLMDMNLVYDAAPEVISSSVIGMKFNNKINSNMSGGRIALPIEYFGTQSQNYSAEPSGASSTNTSADLARPGLEYSGGSGEDRPRCGLLTMNDYKKLHAQYEQKYLRKLKLSAEQKKAVLRSLNEDIERAFVQSVKENKYGRLTVSGLKKNLKN
jgi:hypothetical protein